MTRTEARKAAFPIALCLCLLLCGCGESNVDLFASPNNARESAEVVRSSAAGPVAAVFTSYPLRDGAPPDGVRVAMLRASARIPCSVATFHWTERGMAERWINGQLELRRQQGLPRRLILAGHGFGATEAAEYARDLLFNDREVELVLLLTVDAVKTGRLSGAATAGGAAIVNRLPGVNMNITAYEAAPVPDGRRFRSHINYYQLGSPYYHGAAMPGAENHLLSDWTGLLNHGNADDFALPLLTADLRAALKRSLQ